MSRSSPLSTQRSEGLRSADELMTYLSLYGIRSELAVIAAVPGDDEGLPVRQFVIEQQMDLLVMGAFGTPDCARRSSEE